VKFQQHALAGSRQFPILLNPGADEDLVESLVDGCISGLQYIVQICAEREFGE